MNIGERFTLAWKHPHRIECEITALEQDRVVVNAVHRCPVTCELLQMRATLPIEGRMAFRYQDFDKLFQRMSDGIPLPHDYACHGVASNIHLRSSFNGNV